MSHLGSRISALVDGQLSVADTERALAHVAVCPECSAELAASRAARTGAGVRRRGRARPRPHRAAALARRAAPSPSPATPSRRRSGSRATSSRPTAWPAAGSAPGAGGPARRCAATSASAGRRSRLAAGSMAGLGAVAAMLFVLGERPDVVPTVHPGADLEAARAGGHGRPRHPDGLDRREPGPPWPTGRSGTETTRGSGRTGGPSRRSCPTAGPSRRCAGPATTPPCSRSTCSAPTGRRSS